MRIGTDVGPRKPAAVQQTGVVLAIVIDHVAGADQGGNRAGVGGKAGRKHQGRPGPFEFGQALGQALVGGAWPVTSGLAPLPQPSCRRASATAWVKPGIGGQAEIIVRAEVDQLAAVRR